jgi:hypothetical protein
VCMWDSGTLGEAFEEAVADFTPEDIHHHALVRFLGHCCWRLMPRRR